MWPYMCMCCGLFVRTQFQFESCGVCDDYDDKKLYIYIFLFFKEMFAKNMKPLWKVKGSFNRTSWKVSDLRIVRDTWVLSSVSLSLCLSLCVCLCLCALCVVVVLVVVVVVVVVVEGEEGERLIRTIWAKVSLKNAET